MKDWTTEDIRNVGPLIERWDELSDQKKRDVAITVTQNNNAREVAEALRFIEWIKHPSRKKWDGFSDQQKREIVAWLPGQSDPIQEIEKAADKYIDGVAAEADGKRQALIVGLCLRLSKELKDADSIIYGDDKFSALNEAVSAIIASLKKYQRAPKDNAKQGPRNRYMDELLDLWLHAGGELGGNKSSMVSFFKSAWPQPLLRNRPSSEAIVQWAYKNERKTYRVIGGLIRRVDSVANASNQETRDRAASKLRKFESRHTEQLVKITSKGRLKNE
jgi:hypothetical protein